MGEFKTPKNVNGGKVGTRKSFGKPLEKMFVKKTGAPGGRPSGGFSANPRKFRHSSV